MAVDTDVCDDTLPDHGRGPGAPAGVALRPGDIISQKYRVERVLGAGGMGVVVAATHLDLHERVALKLMLPEALASAKATGRFLREARAAAKVKGEHVARVLDVGKLETGAPYIVMEYLEGVDLAALLEQQGRLPINEALEYVLQACEAIAEAHSLGIIHRDLKPANLFLTKRPDGSPCIKVLDFGISKVLPKEGADEPEDLVRTKTKEILGTPVYMSPEQLTSSRSVGVATDIWSLGAILFELVTGVQPFIGSSLAKLRHQILSEPAPLLRAYNPDAPQSLEAVVARCLEKDPAKRYRDVAELALALKAFTRPRARSSIDRIRGILRRAERDSGTDTAAPRSGADTAAPGPGADTIAPASSVGVSGSHGSSRWKMGIVALAAGGALGVAAIALDRSPPDPVFDSPIPTEQKATEPEPSVAPSVSATPPSAPEAASPSDAPSALPAVPTATAHASASAGRPKAPVRATPPAAKPAETSDAKSAPPPKAEPARTAPFPYDDPPLK